MSIKILGEITVQEALQLLSSPPTHPPPPDNHGETSPSTTLTHFIHEQETDLEVHAVLLHGSWNRIPTTRREAETLGDVGDSNDCCSILSSVFNHPTLASFIDRTTLVISSLMVDDSDESLSIITNSGEGIIVDSVQVKLAFQAPSSIPCLVLVSKPKTVENKGQVEAVPKVEYVNVKPSVLLSCLLVESGDLLGEDVKSILLDAISASLLDLLETSGMRRQNDQPVMDLNATSSVHDKDTDHEMDIDQETKQQDNGMNAEETTNNDNTTTTTTNKKTTTHNQSVQQDTLRIFIAGDKSQVGKSTICLGLLGTLLAPPYSIPPSKLAYIKPATQCEAPQLVTKFCNHHGIGCVPIGPLVYYKGFTRAFLNGDIEDSSEDLLKKISKSVDDISRGKTVVLIDGVGYPAVGSVCGTDNAKVASVSGPLTNPMSLLPSSSHKLLRTPSPVLLVGKSGVGDAIDSYNLNATFFESNQVPVMGCVFNRLSMDESHFYSLERCRKPIEQYFDKFKKKKTGITDQKVFGFVPQVDFVEKSSNDDGGNKKVQTEEDLDRANELIRNFARHVDVTAILKSAKVVTDKLRRKQLVGIEKNRHGNYQNLRKHLLYQKNDPTVDKLFHGINMAPLYQSVVKKLRMDDHNTNYVDKTIKKTNKINPPSSIEKNPVRLTREQIEAAAVASGASSG